MTARYRIPSLAKVSLAEMSPAYFGLVMATGIVSLASFLMGHRLIASGLFYLNIVQFLVLWALYVLRAVHHPRRFFDDMVGHLTGLGYFTAAAGAGILASQFMIQRENIAIGAGQVEAHRPTQSTWPNLLSVTPLAGQRRCSAVG